MSRCRRKRYCVMVAQQTLTLFVWVQILVPLPRLRPGALGFQAWICIEVWLSLVERYVRDVEAAGSNPVTSTTAKTAIYWGILGISPFLRTFPNRDTVWKAVFSASKMAFCLKMQNKIPHRFGPWRIASGPFLFAYISLPSGNMNPTRAFAPRASAICCHSSTVNLPVFIRLLSSRVISVPRPGSPLGKTKKAAEISRPNLNWRTYQYA